MIIHCQITSNPQLCVLLRDAGLVRVGDILDGTVARASDPSRTEAGVSLQPTGGTVALADLRCRRAAVLVVDGDAVGGVDAAELDSTEVYSTVIKEPVCDGGCEIHSLPGGS